MNVTVFGATGAMGSRTINELLANGHTVTAYARNPNKIPPSWGNRISMIIGEPSDADAIDRAVAGAVVSALGPSLDRKAADMPLIEGTRNILNAMKRHGVTRYIGHATPTVSSTPMRSPRGKPGSSASWDAPASPAPTRN